MDEFEEKQPVTEETEAAEPAREDAAQEPQAPEVILQQSQETYTPRPLGFRIFALVLAILVIIGTIIYYYNIFTAGR